MSLKKRVYCRLCEIYMTLIFKKFKVYVDVVTFSFSEVLVSAQEKKENTRDLLPTFFNSFNLNFSSVFFSGLPKFPQFWKNGYTLYKAHLKNQVIRIPVSKHLYSTNLSTSSKCLFQSNCVCT